MTHATATHRTATTNDTHALTPARKRLIRQAFTRHSSVLEAIRYLRSLPSFAGVDLKPFVTWGRAIGVLDGHNHNIAYRPTFATQPITQAPAPPVPPTEPATGEWYSVLAIASGLGIGRERVYGWMQFGWLRGGPLFTAADIRAFVRTYPLEVVRLLMDHERTAADVEMCWLWLVSVLAGSREGA